MNTYIQKTALLALALTPAATFAQEAAPKPIVGLVQTFGVVVNMLIPILSLIVVLAFFWGLIRFIFAAGDKESSAAAKSIMIRGILGMFVLVSIWGIIGFIQQSTGTNIDPTTINGKFPDFTPGQVSQ